MSVINNKSQQKMSSRIDCGGFDPWTIDQRKVTINGVEEKCV